MVSISTWAIDLIILSILIRENNLNFFCMAEFMTIIHSNVDMFLSFFAKLISVWLETILHMVWQGARYTGAVGKAYCTFSAHISSLICSPFAMVVHHCQLRGNNTRLTDTGIEKLLSGLQGGVEQVLLLLGRGQSHRRAHL